MTGKSTVSELVCQRVVLSASCLVSELTVSELTCQRVRLSASCLVSELTVSELVCQRDVCLPVLLPVRAGLVRKSITSPGRTGTLTLTRF